jgi:GNAT superfamily N-acetyltransferase
MARIFDREVNEDFQISSTSRAILDEKALRAKVIFCGQSAEIKIQDYDRNTESWWTIAQSALQGEVSSFLGDEFILSGNAWVHSTRRRQGLGSVMQDIKKDLVRYCVANTHIIEPRLLASVRTENVPEQKLLAKHGWKLITITVAHGLWEYRFLKKD